MSFFPNIALRDIKFVPILINKMWLESFNFDTTL